MSKPPKIIDIARAANVSPSTVSRVLTGVVPVAPEKREAVLAAIEQLNYRPNIVARSLVRGRTMAIGVLTQSLASPFYGDIALGIERALHGSGYHPMFASGHWQLAEEREALALLVERQVDALIVLGGTIPDEELRSMNDQVPLIAVGRSVQGLESQCVNAQNEQGAYAATSYLISLGHRRIAHIIGASNHSDSVDRHTGYMRALGDAGIAYDPRLLVQGSFTEQSGFDATNELFGRDVAFSAIFAANDQLAYGARLACYRQGRAVPEDISLIGFDDLLGSTFTTPPLTTINQKTADLGYAAARGTLALLEDNTPNFSTLAFELVIRESTRPVA